MASKSNATAERLRLDPNWSPFFDGVFFDGSGKPIASPFATLRQDVTCMNPDSDYSKAHLYIAALIDMFFLPYDNLSILKDLGTVFTMFFLFFITEEFISWNWIA